MLLKAAYKKKTISVKINSGYTDIELEIGQFFFGRNSAEEQLNLAGSMIYRILKVFEKDGCITVKSNNRFSIITICNFDTYNNEETEDEQPVDSQRTASEQPVNTNKKDKKEKKDKNRGDKSPLTDRELIFLKIMIEVTGRKFKTLDEKTRRQFNDLVELKYTRDDFRKAATTALSEMKSRNKQGYLTPEFITRSIEFQKYVTMNPKQQAEPVLSAPERVLKVKY